MQIGLPLLLAGGALLLMSGQKKSKKKAAKKKASDEIELDDDVEVDYIRPEHLPKAPEGPAPQIEAVEVLAG